MTINYYWLGHNIYIYDQSGNNCSTALNVDDDSCPCRGVARRNMHSVGREPRGFICVFCFPNGMRVDSRVKMYVEYVYVSLIEIHLDSFT